MATRVKTGRRQTASEQKQSSRTAVAGGASASQLLGALRQNAKQIQRAVAQVKAGKVPTLGQPPRFLSEATKKKKK